MMQYLLYLLVLVWPGIAVLAQPDASVPLVLYHITDENGLSDNHVQCVLKDHRGFVWIGTADGLNKIDGSSVTVFKHVENDGQSIGNNNIFSLAEDAAGNIWAGTGDGLAKYDVQQQQFSFYIPPRNANSTSTVIKSVAIDARQHIWCATYAGLFCLDPASGKFTAFYNTAAGNVLNANRLNHVMISRQQQVWLCSYEGVWSFDTGTQRYKKEIHAGNDASFSSLYLYALEDHAGNIWAGCWEKGLKKLDRLTGKVTTYYSRDINTISSMAEVAQPNGHTVLWLSGQLRAFDPATGLFLQYPLPLQFTTYPNVSPGYCSSDNWIWLTSDQGLFIYNPHRQFFHHHFFSDRLTTQSVNFMEWRHQLLIGAQYNFFLKAYDDQWNCKKDYASLLQSFPLHAKQRSASVLCFKKESGNNVWIGTSDGLLHCNLATLAWKWYTHNPNDSSSLPRDFIPCVLPAADKQLWVFPWREGIWTMNTQTGKCTRRLDGFITEAGKKKKLLIADAVEDSSGNLWMADLDEGIVWYEKNANRFSKPFARQPELAHGAAHIFYRNGYCYAFISRRLVKWKPGNNRPQQFPLPPEMDKEVTDIVPDNTGHWWMATTNGLLVFDEAANNFQRFSTTDGLVSNDMNGTLFCRDNGILLFAGDRYITTFNPAQLLQKSHAVPPAIVTDIEVNGHPLAPGNKWPLQLSYLSNNLIFRWTITDYTSPFHNQFYCKLQGIDAGWRYVGIRGEIQYANLSPGSYKLLLKGATADGAVSNTIAIVPFIIHAPFWKTPWFIASLLLLTALLAFAWYRYRLQQALQVERLRAKISTDLHDDIGSTLSSISILSDMAVRENSYAQSQEMLQEIKTNSVSLMEKMDDIVWSINPKNDQLDNLLLRIRRFAAALFEAKNIDYQIHIPDDIKTIHLPMEYRQHIYLIMKEAINNLVKYSKAGFACITATCDHDFLMIIIQDNGIGFTPGVSFPGNGILNMKSRAALMKAVLIIDSASGKGTRVALKVNQINIRFFYCRGYGNFELNQTI